MAGRPTMTGKPKIHKLGVLVDGAEKRHIMIAAKREGVSVGEFLRRAAVGRIVDLDLGSVADD